MSALVQVATRLAATPLGGARAIGGMLRWLAIVTLAVVVVAGAYLTWVRDLPLFRVSSVKITGTEDGLIVSTLTGAAREMTTLHVRDDRFAEIAAQFPVIRKVSAEPSFPTGLRLMVEIREPVAFAQLGDEAVPVAGDGTLLAGVRAPELLPTVAAEADGGSLTGPAVDQVRVIGAAPGPLLGLIEAVSTTKETGIAVQLEGGVEVRFGTPTAAEMKWAAAAAVLADENLTGLTYINVSAPDRPAVGGAVGGPEIAVEVDVATEEPVIDAETVPEAAAGTEVAPETAETGVAAAPVEPESTLEEPDSVP